MKKFILFFLSAFLINPSFIDGYYLISKNKHIDYKASDRGMVLFSIEETKSDTTETGDTLKYSFIGSASSETKYKIPEQTKEEASFSTNFLYFIAAAAAAAIIYVVWPEKDQETKTKATFGTPVQPK